MKNDYHHHHHHYPCYPDESDYTTNAPSYYDELARKNKLLKILAKKIYDYDKELAKRFEEWDKNLIDFPEDVKELLVKWVNDGTLNHIINTEIFNNKLDTSIFEQFQLSTDQQLAQIVISPMQYGAVGDGIADDTLIIQQTIDNAPEDSRIDLLGYRYSVDGIVINKKLTFQNGSLISRINPDRAIIEVTTDGSGTHIDNVYVEINRTTVQNRNVSGIRVENSSNVKITNSHVNGSRTLNDEEHDDVIFINESHNTLVQNTIVENSERECLFALNSTNTTFDNITARNAGYSGIGSLGGDTISVINSRVEGGGASSISINTKNPTIISCVVEDTNRFNGMTIGHTRYGDMGLCVVTGNTVKNAIENGITVSNATSVLIANNIVTNTGDRGIQVQEVLESVNITGNTLVNTDGIRNYSPAKDNQTNITNNNIKNVSGVGIRVFSNGSSTISNNLIDDVSEIAILVDGETAHKETQISSNTLTNVTFSGVRLEKVIYANINGNTFKIIGSQNHHVITQIQNIPLANNTEVVIQNNDFREVFETSFSIYLRGTNNNNARIKGNIAVVPTAQFMSIQNVIYFVLHNMIGLDDPFIFGTIEAGTTTTTINNSNILSKSMPHIIPRGKEYHELGLFVSSVKNGELVLGHTAPSVNRYIYLQC